MRLESQVYSMSRAPDRTYDELERIVGYAFRDAGLLQEALTHRSYVNESSEPSIKDNERLEFFGDAVLSLFVSRLLMERFPDSREGELSRLRASLVGEEALAGIASSLGLGKYMILGKGEERGGRERASLLADAFEALVAAVYLDGGPEVIARLVDACFLPLLALDPSDGSRKDWKSKLQETMQARFGVTPVYVLKETGGPDHAPFFVVEVLMNDDPVGEGEGRSKKEAQQQAARAALERFRTVAGGAGE